MGMIKKNNYSIDEKNKIVSMYKNGYTAKEIGKCLSRTEGAIHKVIQKYKKNIKEDKLKIIEAKAKERAYERKVSLKLISRENSKEISNINLAKVCKSAYKIKDARLVLEKNNTYTWDMPSVIDLRRK